MTRHVIVVGAGSAGSVITRRLLDAGDRVTLLEAGRTDANPAIHDLGRLGELWLSEDDWGYFTTPQRNAAGRRLHWPRGKVQGGSHSLNASIYVRGAHADYDRWVREGATGWGWQDVLPVFSRIENTTIGDDALRGRHGLLDVTEDYHRNPVFESLYAAAVQSGIPANPDYNGASIEGVSWMQLTMRERRRLSTFRAYLGDRLDDPALDARTGVWVTRLLIERGRIAGVEAVVDGVREEFRGDEVVLSAGALDTPRLLLLSGIGPAQHLEELGIDVVADLPGVGENLHDHVLAPVICHTDRRPIPAREEFEPVAQVHHFTTFREGADTPDTQPIYFDVPMLEPGMEAPGSSFTIHAGLVRPLSRGTFRLASADPSVPALMDPNLFDDPADLASLVASLRQCREIAQQPAIVDEWGAVEIYPGPDVATDDELEQYVREHCVTYHHQVGTCRMGTDELAVVDPENLRLRGDLSGLTIADASVMPSVTSGNTNAPSIMIGERAADFLTV